MFNASTTMACVLLLALHLLCLLALAREGGPLRPERESKRGVERKRWMAIRVSCEEYQHVPYHPCLESFHRGPVYKGQDKTHPKPWTPPLVRTPGTEPWHLATRPEPPLLLLGFYSTASSSGWHTRCTTRRSSGCETVEPVGSSRPEVSSHLYGEDVDLLPTSTSPSEQPTPPPSPLCVLRSPTPARCPAAAAGVQRRLTCCCNRDIVITLSPRAAAAGKQPASPQLRNPPWP